MVFSDPLIGQQLGDYRIDDLLGRGGMAHVYRGYDPKLQRYAAVKVIDSNLLAKGDEDEYRVRFQREARAIAHLNHPNIVGVYQFGEVGVRYYMAMVFIEGRDLGQILKEHNANGTLLPHDEVFQVIHDIGGALDYAHELGVIHRDIKPSNIMVTLDHRAVLTDFGLALSVPEGTLGNTFGSAYYIAPEQAISSANAVAQSDLYSLGVVLFQMLTGRVPFDDPSAMSVALMHLSDTPPSPRGVNPALSPAIEQVVLKALEKEPSRRFQSGEQMIRALEGALAESPKSAPLVVSHTLTPTEAERPDTLLFPDEQVVQSRQRIAEARRRLSVSAGGHQRRRLYAGIALILLLAGGLGGSQLLRGRYGFGNVTPTPVVALGAQTDEPTAVRSATASPSVTSSATATSTRTATRTATPTLGATVTNPPTATAPSPTPLSAAATPAVTEAVVETAVAALSATQSGTTPILLRYDNDKLVLINRSTRRLSIRYLSFVRYDSFGAVSFTADQWESPLLSAVLPQTCFLIWRNNRSEVETPDYCNAREAWFAAGNRSRFWISNQPEASFEVWNAGNLVATCAISAGECAVDPQR
jgi:predicted Ser/Thr protein kinase